MGLIANEVHFRQAEGLGRDAERFWNCCALIIAAVVLGTLIGDWVGD